VINGAMKGYSSFQGLYLLRKVCLRYNPDCLVIAYLHSDFVRDALEDKRANTNPPVVRALQELLYESNLYLLLRQKLLEMKPAAAPGASRVHRVSKDDFGRNLREIAGLCRARGIRMIFLNMPEEKRNTPGEDDPWRAAMKEAAGESGSPVLDLLDLFNKGERKGERLCFDSVHPNKEGHAVIAEALFKELAGKEAR
jgi:lysophospholipase L1-like esterase